MIVTNYASFRGTFALVGALIDFDGFEAWPLAKLRSGGFTGLATPTISVFPFTMTVNGGAMDGGAAYDWWLSQRTDAPAAQPLTIAQAALNKSGTVSIDVVSANVQALLPGVSSGDYAQGDNLALILKNCHIYVQRRSDKAIQWVTLYVG